MTGILAGPISPSHITQYDIMLDPLREHCWRITPNTLLIRHPFLLVILSSQRCSLANGETSDWRDAKCTTHTDVPNNRTYLGEDPLCLVGPCRYEFADPKATLLA